MICKLCSKDKKLKESHLIPKFIYSWLKKTSATGYFRWSLNPNLRRQDGFKKKYFCAECETQLSKVEGEFSKKFFIPFIENIESKKTNYSHDLWLKKLAVSLNWRMLIYAVENSFIPLEINALMDIVEIDWRKYLLGELKNTIGEHHIVLFGNLKKPNKYLPVNFFTYLRRDIDAGLVIDQQKIFVYTKLPSILILSLIYPTSLNNWENTKIFDKGVIISPQKVIDSFGMIRYLIDRANLVHELANSKISPKQEKAINKSLFKDLTKSLKSGSVKACLEDLKNN